MVMMKSISIARVGFVPGHMRSYCCYISTCQIPKVTSAKYQDLPLPNTKTYLCQIPKLNLCQIPRLTSAKYQNLTSAKYQDLPLPNTKTYLCQIPKLNLCQIPRLTSAKYQN